MEVYERIKNRRKLLKLSADDLAEALGVSRATIYRYESAEIEKLPVTTLEPLAKVLRCSPAYLMGWEDTPEGTAAQEAPPEETLLVTDPMEQQLVKTYQILDDYGKRAVIRTANGEAERCLGTAAPGEKEGSLPA